MTEIQEIEKMKEHPIIFSTDMVKAILEGRKTQTRRIVKTSSTVALVGVTNNWDLPKKPKHHFIFDRADSMPRIAIKCPYGKAGDRLWVRETWCNINKPQCKPDIYFKADTLDAEDYDPTEWKWKPSIHLPYCWHRIDLEITDIRVERLQEISVKDVEKEGIWTDNILFPTVNTEEKFIPIFEELWNSIDRKKKQPTYEMFKYRWEDNPWVWVISFKVFSPTSIRTM